MKTKIVSRLPIPTSGCGDVRFSFNGLDCLLEFEFYKNGGDGDCIGGIYFSDVAAFRFRDEMRSYGYADEAYDVLVEILDSNWKKELKEIEPSRIKSISEWRHFAVYFSSNGYFEVIAKKFVLKEDKIGLLSKSPEIL